MVKNTKISVVIPAYNRAEYLPAAIESVLKQTYKDLEIIIVDDGSTDNTKEVLKPYIEKIKYFHKENAGVSSARNLGIKNADSKWIAFLDSDDRWRPDKLETQIEFIKKNNLKVCFTEIEVERFTKEADTAVLCKKQKIKFNIYNQPFELILKKHGLCIQTMLIDKELLLAAGSFDEKLQVAEDTKLIYELGFITSFGFIDHPFTILNRNESRRGLIDKDIKTKNALTQNHINILKNTYQRSSNLAESEIKKIKTMLSHLYSIRAKNNTIIKKYSQARLDSVQALKVGGNLKTYRRALTIFLSPYLVGLYFRKKEVHGNAMALL